MKEQINVIKKAVQKVGRINKGWKIFIAVWVIIFLTLEIDKKINTPDEVYDARGVVYQDGTLTLNKEGKYIDVEFKNINVVDEEMINRHIGENTIVYIKQYNKGGKKLVEVGLDGVNYEKYAVEQKFAVYK